MISKSVAVLGVPYDGNSSYLKGAALAPRAIIEAFRCDSSNTAAESEMDLGEAGRIVDCGDLNFSNCNFFETITQGVTRFLDQQLPVLSLGGDHSITYPIVSAFANQYGRVDILHFDAHPDLYENFQDNRYSHASPFARIMEDGLAIRLVQVGLRTVNGHQRRQIEKYGVEAVTMKEFDPALALQFERPLYITIDMDGLDPAFAPGVSHPEPGGLSTREVIGVLQRLKAKKIVGADIVEYNPARDVNGITAMVAAKLLKELASLIITANNH